MLIDCIIGKFRSEGEGSDSICRGMLACCSEGIRIIAAAVVPFRQEYPRRSCKSPYVDSAETPDLRRACFASCFLSMSFPHRRYSGSNIGQSSSRDQVSTRSCTLRAIFIVPFLCYQASHDDQDPNSTDIGV